MFLSLVLELLLIFIELIKVEGIQKKEEADAMWRPPFQNPKISMKTKKEDASLWPEDANGASSHDVQSLNGKLVFQKVSQNNVLKCFV